MCISSIKANKENIMMYIYTFINLGILVSISIILALLGNGAIRIGIDLFSRADFWNASVVGMLHPLVITKGLIFDGCSVMISLAVIFLGPLARIYLSDTSSGLIKKSEVIVLYF